MGVENPVLYSYHGIPHNDEKEQTATLLSAMDGTMLSERNRHKIM